MRRASLPSQPVEPISLSTSASGLSSLIWWVGVSLKLIFASSLVIGLLVAYGLRFAVVSWGPFSFGLYGVIILADFIVQTSCSFLNRKRVERISRKAENRGDEPLDICVAVVGYREDSDAWRKCLASLQKQDHAPRAIIGVVDGQDAPDQVMAEDFRRSFPEGTVLIADLPELLSKVYATTYWACKRADFHSSVWRARAARLYRSIGNLRTQDEIAAETLAWAAVHAKLDEWDEQLGISKYNALCLTQPHGHKRTAMFTAFAIAIHLFKTKDAVFTTDSDTLLDPAALRQMSYILASDSALGGVTGDVKIWNKDESWLALMCALRYWFAFNIERACQSYWRCVTCISGPIGLYRVRDMQIILGPWILQTFLGRDCTFGDDRHLTNRLLGIGRQTAYTHLAFCESDSPAGFVRWVKQQTRWSKSFFREAFWHPSAFAYQSTWLSIETLKQTLYPFILVSTVFQFLYAPTTLLRPAFWMATMFGVALIKSTYGFVVTGDPTLLLFAFYAPLYFFGLLPSKIYALFTINVTAWGTSARSAAERRRSESYSSRSSHISHLLIWFCSLGAGFIIFAHHHAAGRPLLYTFPVVLPVATLCIVPYWDIVQGDLKYYGSKVKTLFGVRTGSIRSESGAMSTAAEKDLEKGYADAGLAQAMPPQAWVAEVITPLGASLPDQVERKTSSQSLVSMAFSTDQEAGVQVERPHLVDPFEDQPASQKLIISINSPRLGLKSATSSRSSLAESLDTIESLQSPPLTMPQAAVSRHRSSEDAQHVTEAPKRPAATQSTSDSRLSDYPQEPPADRETRRPSLTSWDRDSWGRRKSSVKSFDSSMTLVDDYGRRRSSKASRRPSLFSVSRPPLSGRSSQATLVDGDQPASFGQRRSSQSHVRKASFGQLYESSWAQVNPFSPPLQVKGASALPANEVAKAVELARGLTAYGTGRSDALAGTRLGVKEGYQSLTEPTQPLAVALAGRGLQSRM